MTEKQLVMPSRCAKSIKYNRFSKEEAIDICSIRLKPYKSPLTPVTCVDCYYHDGKCEWGRNELCFRYRDDINYSNKVHWKILNDYEWCIKHFEELCSLDKELFVAIYGVIRNGAFYVTNEGERMDDRLEELHDIIDEVLIENRVPKEFRDLIVRSIIGRCSRAGFIKME